MIPHHSPKDAGIRISAGKKESGCTLSSKPGAVMMAGCCFAAVYPTRRDLIQAA
jgi:hypothetical protein